MDDGCAERRPQEQAERRGAMDVQRVEELRLRDSHSVVYSRPGCKENLHTPLKQSRDLTSGSSIYSAQVQH
jgi:hypothetical protein